MNLTPFTARLYVPSNHAPGICNQKCFGRYMKRFLNLFSEPGKVLAPNFVRGKPFTKFGAIEPPFDVLIVGKRSGSITSTFLKRHSSEKLVLWNRHCLSSVFATDNTAAQRLDSTKFSDRKTF